MASLRDKMISGKNTTSVIRANSSNKNTNSTFRSKALHGIAWSGFANMGKQGIQIVGSIVLARLLTPEDFGLLAMLLVFTGFSTIIMSFGFGQALIQKKEVTHTDWSSVFWFNTVVSAVLAGILFFTAPWIADFYREPRLIAITRVISSTLLLGGLVMVHRTRFTKKIDFKTISKIDIIASLGGVVIGVGMALAGFGVWSLVGMQLAIPFITFLGFWVTASWMPSLIYRHDSIKSILSFGLHLFGANTLNYVSQKIDSLIVGRFVGASVLGFYSRGYRFMFLPVQLISSQLRQVMFPSFSSIQDDKEKVNRVFLLTNQTIAMFSFPMMAFVIVMANELIYYILGAQWMGMVPYLRIFAFIGLFASINGFRNALLLAYGQSKLIWRFGLISKAFNIPLMCLGIFWGGIGVALGRLLGVVLNFFPILFIMGKKTGLGFWPQLKIYVPVFFAVILSSGVLLVFQFMFVGLLPLSITIVALLLGTVVYYLLCYWQKPAAFMKIQPILINGMNRLGFKRISWKKK